MNDFIIENNILIKYIGKEKEINIPNGIIEIAPDAFYNMKFIEKIILPDSLNIISSRAISCMGDNFNEIIIPKSVSYIDYLAFDCDNLKRIYIYNPNISIAIDAFDHNYNLKDIYFNGTKEEWSKAILITDDYNDLLTSSDNKIHYIGNW